jgi:deoxyadenosine/deoxycytidine kinase
MEQNDLPDYEYICIEGNIGTGKTTLCKLLSQDYKCELILEQFTDNPFLPMFYKEPGRYAFPVELFFMTERYKQLQESLVNKGIFHDYFLADYFFRKTAIFAQNNLEEEEYRLFLRFFDILNSLFPNPDLLVYLHRSVDKLYEQIQARNRLIEKDLKKSYLLEIQNMYFEFFRTERDYPILIIDVEDLNFQDNPEHYQQLKNLIFRSYQPGVHRISMGS